MPVPHLDIRSIPLGERIALAQELWDSIHADAPAAPLPPDQREEIERRIAAADAREYVEIPASELFNRLGRFE